MGEPRFFATGASGVNDSGFGGLVESRDDFGESLGGFVFFAGFDVFEETPFERFQAGFDLLVLLVFPFTVPHPPLG